MRVIWIQPNLETLQHNSRPVSQLEKPDSDKEER